MPVSISMEKLSNSTVSPRNKPQSTFFFDSAQVFVDGDFRKARGGRFRFLGFGVALRAVVGFLDSPQILQNRVRRKSQAVGDGENGFGERIRALDRLGFRGEFGLAVEQIDDGRNRRDLVRLVGVKL